MLRRRERGLKRSRDEEDHSLGNFDELGEPTEPHDVGLEDVDGAVLDELAEAVPVTDVSGVQLERKSARCSLDVGLDNGHSAVLDELAETVLGVLVLAGGELDVGEGLLELEVAVKVVGVEDLLPPVDVDAGFLACLRLVSGGSGASNVNILDAP
jgi:hypothetical protein